MNQEVKKYLTELLFILNKEIPMHPAKPNITVNDNGFLQLNILIEKFWYTWNFDELVEMPASVYAYLIINNIKERAFENQ